MSFFSIFLSQIRTSHCPAVYPNNFNWRKEFELSATKQKNQSIYTRLSDEAKTILIEASNSINGTITYGSFFEGDSIGVNEKSLIPDLKPRTTAKWKAALTELINERLIEPLNDENNLFKITNKGYETADKF